MTRRFRSRALPVLVPALLVVALPFVGCSSKPDDDGPGADPGGGAAPAPSSGNVTTGGTTTGGSTSGSTAGTTGNGTTGGATAGTTTGTTGSSPDPDGGTSGGPLAAPPFRVLGTFTTAFDPAFLYLEAFPSGSTSLLVTTFSAAPFGTSGVGYVPSIGSALGALGSAKDTKLNTSMKWPNEAKTPPAGIFPSDGVLVAGGFLVPGNTTGAITFVDAGGSATKLTTDRTDFFYHRIFWVDMNGDGRLDMLTARAKKPTSGATAGELLWLEQPAASPLAKPWAEHLLLSGNDAPDVHFAVDDLDGDGSPEIVAAQFFSKKLRYYWFEGSKDAAGLKSAVIDDTIGSAFEVQIVDLDGDGKKDLLATNHEEVKDEAKAGVFAYEVPPSPRTGAWTKHVLAAGFKAISPNVFVPNAMAPGAAMAFFPRTTPAPGEKPAILVSGDDYQKVTLLYPKSSAKGAWAYGRTDVVDTKATCGGMAIGDVDGDGWVEAFVPAYGKKTVHVVTFKK